MRRQRRAPKKKDTRTKRWVFTSFLDELPNFNEQQMSYMCHGLETCPDTGRKHHQGYVVFHNKKSFTAAKKLMPKDQHIEPAKGTTPENIAYCSKDAPLTEHGVRPAQGSRSDLQQVVKLLEDGNDVESVARAMPVTYIKHFRGIMSLRNRLMKRRTWKTKVICHWGPTGSGKTRTAIEAGANMVSFDGSFFNGYEGQEIILLDEIEKMNFPRHTLLQIMDRYPLPVNIKGSYMHWVPKVLYMTGITHPHEWFGGGPEWERRIDSIVEFPIALSSPPAVAPPMDEEDEKEIARAMSPESPVQPQMDPVDSDTDYCVWIAPPKQKKKKKKRRLHFSRFIDDEAGCPDDEGETDIDETSSESEEEQNKRQKFAPGGYCPLPR